MGDNSQKVREATEEVREVGDVYPLPPSFIYISVHLMLKYFNLVVQ